MTIAQLISHIFEGQATALSEQFEEWVKSSRRFRTFGETYRDKIRKKVRTVEDGEAIKSLYAELFVTWCLLQDQRFVVEYEKYGSGKQRSPDFSVSFRVNTRFNLEITRLRSPERRTDVDVQLALSRKLTDAILGKIGQLRSDTPNALVVFASYNADEEFLNDVLRNLRLKAETKQEDFFTGRGFQSAAEFLKQFRRLSVLIYGRGDTGIPTTVTLWINSLASHSFPPGLLNPLLKVLDAEN